MRRVACTIMRRQALAWHACTLVIACSLPAVQAPAQAPAGRETVTYRLEDFESFTPWVWQWSGANRGWAEPETAQVHGGQRAVALSWDFSAATGWFACFMLGHRMAGEVQEVRAWIWATERERGTPLALWVRDRTEETYILRATVDWVGWKQVRFPMAGLGPAWDSGDKNRQQDLPLSLFGLAVEFGGPKVGRLVVDELEVVALLTPREALDLTPTTGLSKNLFWDTLPTVDFSVRNYSGTPVSGVACELRVEDLYRGIEVWTGQVDFAQVAGKSTAKRTQELNVPYGVYRVHWRLRDAQGELLSGSLDVSRMMPPCYRNAPESVREYERRWGLLGGVLGSMTPQLASDMGARWVRYESSVWSDYEREPGRFDMSALEKGMRPYKEAGIESVILQTLYQAPAFRNPDQVEFAPAYGEAMRQTALAARNLANCFELGNEDNGPTKKLYSEVARHAAAAIRSVQPHALIANSGTAFIDLGWLQMQAERGVFDVLDVLCTHPYTANDSPEAWGIYERLGQVNQLIDQLGGMKIQWTTEFGWHHDFDQLRRAQWIPRHFLISAAAGIERHGLYTWERDYGIFQGPAQPPAASVHALAKMIEGHRFVGLLHQGDDYWACVWERAGEPLVIAWSPVGKAEWSVAVGPDAQAYDLFGNPLPQRPEAGELRLALDGGPVYVTGVAKSVFEAAVLDRCQRERERLFRCVAAANLPADSPWRHLIAMPEVYGEQIAQALRAWAGQSGPIGRGEQAVVAQALRWLRNAPLAAAPAPPEQLRADLDEARQAMRRQLEHFVANDTDVPALRYLLERWDRLADEEQIAAQHGSRQQSAILLWQQEVVHAVCTRFMRDGERILFGMWPYLYTLKEDGILDETLRFVPGESTLVRVRVSNYGARERSVAVSLRLPLGWGCEPERLALSVAPGARLEGQVRISCPPDAPTEEVRIQAVLEAQGLPPRVVVFDDVVIEAPFRLSIAPVRGLLPQTPLEATLSNPGTQPLSGLLRLMRRGDTRALARAEVANVSREAPLSLRLPLTPRAPLPYHEWPLVADLILADGRRIERPATVDFACAVRAPTPPRIDGDLADWANATPLHLDREEYGKGSFAGKWTPEDCSAATYVMWDDACVYFAARVTDQTFNQTLSGTSQWIQDSIQLAFARDEHSPRTELGLALTPHGEEVVSYTAPEPAVAGARLKVRLSQGSAAYEAAIPWAAIAGLQQPKPGTTIRYAVLVNDDDAVTGRRFLERYGGIAHDKEIKNFGYLTLLADTGEGTARPETDLVFVEDFEEYPEGRWPDAWQAVSHEPPVPEARVMAGVGRDGSRGLVLTNNTGERPYVYLNFVRALPEVRPGQSYELRCWARGRGVVARGGIIGVCSDLWGNEASSYAEHGELGEGWQEITLPFSGPAGGRLNLIIRNATKMEELVLDDITVRRK